MNMMMNMMLMSKNTSGELTDKHPYVHGEH